MWRGSAPGQVHIGDNELGPPAYSNSRPHNTAVRTTLGLHTDPRDLNMILVEERVLGWVLGLVARFDQKARWQYQHNSRTPRQTSQPHNKRSRMIHPAHSTDTNLSRPNLHLPFSGSNQSILHRTSMYCQWPNTTAECSAYNSKTLESCTAFCVPPILLGVTKFRSPSNLTLFVVRIPAVASTNDLGGSHRSADNLDRRLVDNYLARVLSPAPMHPNSPVLPGETRGFGRPRQNHKF